MKQGIGEWLLDNVAVPISLGLLVLAYWVRSVFRKVGL